MAKKKTKKKSNAGRPSKFDQRFPAMAAKLARQGQNNKEIADFFEVSESTFYRWLEASSEFWESLKESKEAADDLVEAALFKRATGFTHPETIVSTDKMGNIRTKDVIKYQAPNVTAQIFWLKNRRPEQWREKANEDETDFSITLNYSPRSQRDGSSSDSE